MDPAGLHDPEVQRRAALRGSLQTAFYAVALLLMVGWILYAGRGIIVPFFSAIIVVYVVIGLDGVLGRAPWIGTHSPRWLRNVFAILVIAAMLWLVVTLMTSNVGKVGAALPRYESRLLAFIQLVMTKFGIDDEPTWTTLRNQAMRRVDLRALLSRTFVSVSQIVAAGVVVFFYSIFLLAEMATFDSKLNKLSRDPASTARLRGMIAAVNGRIGRYLALKTFVNVVLALISYTAMRVIGVEFAAFWALLIGFLNYIPYLGSWIGVGFPVLFAALQFPELGTVILLLVVLSVAQLLVGSFIDPYVMGNSLNLSPTVILLSLAVWSAIWGIPGAILSVPITASILLVLASFESTRPIAVMLSHNGNVGDPIPPVPTSEERVI